MDPEPHSLLLLFFNINTAFISGLIGFCVLLILSAIISGAEVALFSLSKSEIDNASQTHPQQIKTVKSLLKSPKKLLATIPIPINVEKIHHVENIISGKIKVFHGISRSGLKGTKYIEEAFKILSKRYPNELELTISGHMPLEEYFKVMKKTNIVIDQVYSYSAGMNALFAMASGKVVLGGSEIESLSELKIDRSPLVNIKPDCTSIVNAVEYFIQNKASIKIVGLESRKFVEKYHSHKMIAQKYIDLWESV